VLLSRAPFCIVILLHCALASGTVYCNRSCLCVCVSVAGGRVGGVRTLLQPARAQCLRLSELFFIYVFCLLVVLVRLSVPVQMIDWKDSSPK